MIEGVRGRATTEGSTAADMSRVVGSRIQSPVFQIGRLGLISSRFSSGGLVSGILR